jgi:transposase
VPALPSWLIDPIWDQCSALIPPSDDHHPLGCHRLRIPDRLVFDKLVQVLVFGCPYHRIADASCSATTLRLRRDAWIAAGVMDQLLDLALAADDRMIGLALDDLVVDGCITKAPCGGEVAGRSPVDRGKHRLKRSIVVDANGIPLGSIAAPANRHDFPLLDPTRDAVRELCAGGATVHLNRGYASTVTHERIAARGLVGAIAPKGVPAPIAASQRWPVEGTTAWTNAHKKLVWCTERRAVVVGFWLAFSAVVIVVQRLIREAWIRNRWDGRHARTP